MHKKTPILVGAAITVAIFANWRQTAAYGGERPLSRSCSDELHEFVPTIFGSLLTDQNGSLRIGYGFTTPPSHELLQVGFQGATSETTCQILIEKAQTWFQATLAHWEEHCAVDASGPPLEDRFRINCSGREPYADGIYRKFILRRFLLEDESSIQEEFITQAEIDMERRRSEERIRKMVEDMLNRDDH